jgi:DNA-binding NarL/FixJ family response regulator
MEDPHGQNQGQEGLGELPLRRWILVIDDHPMMRSGLSHVINLQPDMSVCGEAGKPSDVFHLLSRVSPDLILTDLTMGLGSGVEFIEELVAARTGLPILVVSMHDENEYAERCLQAGAQGYIQKDSGADCLLAAIRCVLAGEVYVSPTVSRKLSHRLSGWPRAPADRDDQGRELSSFRRARASRLWLPPRRR